MLGTCSFIYQLLNSDILLKRIINKMNIKLFLTRVDATSFLGVSPLPPLSKRLDFYLIWILYVDTKVWI